jgi:hypothetical protein
MNLKITFIFKNEPMKMNITSEIEFTFKIEFYFDQ